jgi:hypothetical protein
VLAEALGHLRAQRTQPVARQPSVEDVVGIVDLPVTADMDDGRLHEGKDRRSGERGGQACPSTNHSENCSPSTNVTGT